MFCKADFFLSKKADIMTNIYDDCRLFCLLFGSEQEPHSYTLRGLDSTLPQIWFRRHFCPESCEVKLHTVVKNISLLLKDVYVDIYHNYLIIFP